MAKTRRPGRHPNAYEGKLLHGRWLVSELGYGHGTYVIHDKEARLIEDDKNMVMHFNSVLAAEKHVEKLSGRALTKQKSTAKKPQALQDTAHKSAASMFRALISAGSLSDDQIFAEVQRTFDLDDSKRSYVGWYRKDLQKKGLL